MSRLLVEIKYSLISFSRNRGAIFWTMLFPIVILVLLGYVLGGGSGTFTLYYSDADGTQTSHGLLQALNSTSALQLKDGSGMDLAQELKDGKIDCYVEIPEGFEKSMLQARMSGGNVSGQSLQLFYDKSKTSSMAVISILQEVVNAVNMNMTGTRALFGVSSHDVTTTSVSYLDFLLPGIIGMAIMSSAVNGTVGTMAHNRATGVFRKLATTPISRIEWNAARIITQTIILMISTGISLFAGWLVFGIHPNINPLMVAMVVAGGAVFSGLGMIMTRFIKDEDTAANAASALTFPLMFVSGSFIPVQQLPWFLQSLAEVSPLTYLNNGLRSSMITGNYGDALASLLIVGTLGTILFAIGVAVLKWKED